jgi:uncharacterized protein (TIGR03435 family)
MAVRRVLILVAACAAGLAQSGRTSFEVAALKFHPEPITLSADPVTRGSRVTATAVTLVDLITSAYGVRYDQITGGPAWSKSDHYDLSAKAEGEAPLTAAESRQMLQGLLAERFQLVVRRETREVPVYALVVAKGGSKMRETSADEEGDNFTRTNGGVMHMVATRGTMERLARQLSGTSGRPVVDRTGLKGYYAYKLEWTPANRPSEPDAEVPSLFTAIQEQLGLRLENAKGPWEMLVIERAEKPAAN